MPAVKPLDRTADKWARVAQVSGPEYEAGVRAPRKSWAQATANAASNYAKGVQAAIAGDRFSKGVKRVGDSHWQDQTLKKGPLRWAEGINLAKEAYKAGFAPYRDVIENVVLPPRGPVGDPANIQRVSVITTALHKKKLEMKGA